MKASASILQAHNNGELIQLTVRLDGPRFNSCTGSNDSASSKSGVVVKLMKILTFFGPLSVIPKQSKINRYDFVVSELKAQSSRGEIYTS